MVPRDKQNIPIHTLTVDLHLSETNHAPATATSSGEPECSINNLQAVTLQSLYCCRFLANYFKN